MELGKDADIAPAIVSSDTFYSFEVGLGQYCLLALGLDFSR